MSDPNPFDADIAEIGGYVYTTNARLSSRMANQRLTAAAEAAVDFASRRVLDIGCGDGEYTVGITRACAVRSMCGVDVNVAGLAVAQQKSGGHGIRFVAGSAEALPFRNGAFEIGQLRGVLHHLDRPAAVLQEAFRVCSTVAIIEPNGYNPVLKVLERISPYHLAHGEKSYAPRRLDGWIAAAGARVTRRCWAGLVPMFCPDWMARLLKRVEPIVERVPLFNRIACAVYVASAQRSAPE